MLDAATKGAENEKPVGFRFRLKFKLASRLNEERTSIEARIDGKDITIASAWGNKKLKDSEWVAMSAGGFETPDAALAFGERLRLTVQLIAARHRIGADCGADRAPGGMSNVFRAEVFKATGRWFRNSVHGIDVYEDHENILFVGGWATAHTLSGPTQFVQALDKYHLAITTLSTTARDILLLLNFALMTSEPVAQTVIAISAVEMIGQNEKWSDAQAAAIAGLADQVRQDNSLTSAEATELAESIEKGLHKISLRQGVKRLLQKLALPHLMKDWDKLYGERSTLVHGLAPEPGKDYSGLANRAVTLSGHILLTALSKEMVGLGENLSSAYPIESLLM